MWMSYAFVLSLGIVSLNQVVTQGPGDSTTGSDGQTNGNSGLNVCNFADNYNEYIAVKWDASSSIVEHYKPITAADWKNRAKAFVVTDPNNKGNEIVYAEYDGDINLITLDCEVTFVKSSAQSTLLNCDYIKSECTDVGKRDLSLALNAYCMNDVDKVKFGYLENFFWSSFIYTDTEWDTYKHVYRGYFSSSNHDYPFIVTQYLGENILFTKIPSEEEVECYQIYFSERKYVINSETLENQVGKNNFFNFHGCTISSNQEYIINKDEVVLSQDEGTLKSQLKDIDAQSTTNGITMRSKSYQYITGNPNCVIKLCTQISSRDDVISIQQGPDFHLERTIEGYFYEGTPDPAVEEVEFSCYSDITDKCKNAKYFYYYEDNDLVPSDVHQCGDVEDSNVCQSDFDHEYISLVQITNKFEIDCAWGGSASTVFFQKVDDYDSGDCLMKKSKHLYISQTDTDGNVNFIEYKKIAVLPSDVDKTSCDVETTYSFSTNSALCAKKDRKWNCDDALTLLINAAMDLSA